VKELESLLKDNSPDLVITDSSIDNKEEMENILKLSRDKNPEAKFIIMSEEAVLLKNRPLESFKILGIVEKPFHFPRVMEILESRNKSSLSLREKAPKYRAIDI
jgi:DNA-binding NtrC family response regulator